jgi:hypothetical protein
MRTLLRALVVFLLVTPALAAQQEPPRRLDLGGAPVQEVETRRDTTATSNEMRNAFVRNQLALGIISYGPSFAVMLGTEPATRIAAWMVMAGGSFFAATEIARQVEITPARSVLSSRMGARGSLSGLLLGNAWKLPEGEIGGLTLVGGLSGTALGLVMGTNLTEGEAVAAVVGHDLIAASVFATTWVIDPVAGDDEGLSRSGRVAIPLVLGWGGYYLGALWARNAEYEVTAGDASLLWLGAGMGAAAATTFIIESDPSDQVVAGTLLVGGLAGVWGGSRYFVRPFDHTRGEAVMVTSGAGAGALMGIGLGVLLSGDAERNSAPTMAFGTLGAITGAWLTERYVQPRADAGRQLGAASRLHVNPFGAVAAATRTPGMHSIVRFTF